MIVRGKLIIQPVSKKTTKLLNTLYKSVGFDSFVK